MYIYIYFMFIKLLDLFYSAAKERNMAFIIIWNLIFICTRRLWGLVTNIIPSAKLLKTKEINRGVMGHVLDCDIVVSGFELHSRYYNYFRTNTLGKGIEQPLSPRYELSSTTNVFLQEFGSK